MTENNTSTWHNPTRRTLRCDLYQGPGLPVTLFEVAPGDSKDLPSEFDAAIQQLDESGIIIGGLCPALVRTAGPVRVNSHGRPIQVVPRDNTRPDAL